MTDADAKMDGADAKAEHKVFVGGISYRMDEAGLRDCEFCAALDDLGPTANRVC